MAPNIILDTVLENFLKSQNYTILLPILKQVCGELAEDFHPDMLRAGEKMKTGKPSSLGPGFSAVPGGPQYLNRQVRGLSDLLVALVDLEIFTIVQLQDFQTLFIFPSTKSEH